LKFPDPYDPNLEEKEIVEWHASASLWVRHNAPNTIATRSLVTPTSSDGASRTATIIISGQTVLWLHIPFKKERCIPCSVCHNKLQALSGIDSSPKRSTAVYARS
jgi:hypothetical protein